MMALRSTASLRSPLFSMSLRSPLITRPLSSQSFNGRNKTRRSRKMQPFVKKGAPQTAGLSLSTKEMTSDQLVLLTALDEKDAIKETLKRHIMQVDSIHYKEASEKFETIKKANRDGMQLHSLPYKVGIFTTVGASALSFPLCFHTPSVHWFNETFVTADIPEPKDLETWLEVGAWAWNWMEPLMGQLSFVILCLQLARSQIQNIGLRPYTGLVNRKRAEKLAARFPKYDSALLMKYSRSCSLYNP